jgi:hypothetical protein
MSKFILLLAVVITAAFVAGCGGKVPVKITNDLGAWSIEEIYIDPAENSEWTNNLISETLESGSDVTLNVAPGNYDIMLVDEDGDSYTRWEIEIGSGGYDWSVTLSDIDD